MNIKHGKQIRTLAQLYQASLDRRAVVGVVGYLQRPQPAAFVLSMQARMVYDAINQGMWLVVPKRKRKEVISIQQFDDTLDDTLDDVPF